MVVAATPQGGGRCAWPYCVKWGSLLVEQHDGRGGRERIWVCLTHVVHAEVRGWVRVRPPTSA
jgi:hypothetical protein